MKKYIIISLFVITILVSSIVVHANNNSSLTRDAKQVLILLSNSVTEEKQLNANELNKVESFMKKYRSNVYSEQYNKLPATDTIIIDDVWLSYIDYKSYFELNGYVFKDEQEKIKTKEFTKKEIIKINNSFK